MTTAIARSYVILTVVLSCALLGASGAPADASPQSAQNAFAAQQEAKIGTAAHIQPLRPGFQFPYGQTLHYEGEWRFFTAGVSTVKIEHVGSQNHITATADSTGVVAVLYRVADRFE